MITTALNLCVEFRLAEAALTNLETAAFEQFVAHTRDEPGCQRAELFRRDDDDGLFMLVAEFDDEDALKAHLDASWRLEGIENFLAMVDGDVRRFTMRRFA